MSHAQPVGLALDEVLTARAMLEQGAPGAEVEAHERSIAELRARRERHAVLEEKRVRVRCSQPRAVDPGKVSRFDVRHRQPG
jgi:hypothetical protein